MSIIHVQQIKAKLTSTFGSLIDVPDFPSAAPADRESMFLTRSLAAFSIMHLADVKPETASLCVTDGGQDNGIDAVYCDAIRKQMYLVQSKFIHDGNGSIDRGEAQKFITGVNDIINLRFDRFNPKVQSKSEEITSALLDADTRFTLVVAYTGQNPLAQEVQRDFDDFLKGTNDPTDVMQLRALRQGDLYAIIASGTLGSPINLEVVLRDWGQIREPFLAFYGQVSATEVAAWWDAYHPRLFAPNLRMFLGLTEANLSISETLSSNPEHFWYFNNGITALCATVKKKPVGGASHDSGVFECKDVKIVNGAQTVGAIASANARSPEQVEKATVMVRFISLDQCPEGFSYLVTRATNTQNEVGRRDFVSLDPEQDRLRTELQLSGIYYAYKSGDRHADAKTGFDLSEATVALACSYNDITHAVQAKREIGKLWEDVSKAPYRALFNSSLSGTKLWALVQILREIEVTLKKQQMMLVDRDRMFTVHGNRFIAHQVFKHLPSGSFDLPVVDVAGLSKKVAPLTAAAVNHLIAVADGLYPDSYLASLFKNLSKCKRIDTSMQRLTWPS
jgi:hypothetical protein